MIAAPITGDAGPLGVIEVYSKERDAFTDTDAGLIGALASQAAIAITNARLIDELAAPSPNSPRTADAERTLREIAGPGQRHARPGRDPPVGHRRGGPPAPGERARPST